MNGGQKRTKALVYFYKQHFSKVIFRGIFVKTPYTESEFQDTDLGLGDTTLIEAVNESPHAGELIIGESINKDFHVRSQIAKILMDHKPEIIHVEQVFLYAGLKPLLKELNMQPRIIFGSQNIEYKMKHEIFQGLKLNPQISKEIIEKIYELEKDFSKKADLVIAVSEADAKELRFMGAKHCIVAKNGIEKTTTTQSSIQKWQNFKQSERIDTIVTFVGSGHPPNWVGFLEMVGKDTAFLPPRCKIVLAGGIGDYFEKMYKKTANKGLWKNLLSVGKLSDSHLSGLLQTSEILLLPITSGGGSNLKTAEAILSGKKVVATSYAFRGFEDYKNLPNIYIADTPSQFRALILEALRLPLKKRTRDEIQWAEQVQWKYTLQPIEKELKRLSRPVVHGQIKTNVRKAGRKVKGGLRRIQGNFRRSL